MERPQMVITGERTVPGIWHENYWFRRHEVVYEHVAELLGDEVPRDGHVLEAGCGEGYGADLLAQQGLRVTAVDYDAYAVGHVRRSYPAVQVVRANLVALPFPDATFDAVVSLQTIEHLWDQHAFVAECLRVARPGAPVVVSTPNTLTFPPGNPYHPHELDPDELRELLAAHGRVESLVGLHHGVTIRTWEGEHGSLVDAQLATDPEAWPDPVAAMVQTAGTRDFRLQDDDLETSLDLVAVVRQSFARERSSHCSASPSTR